MCSQLYKIINVVELLFKRVEIEQQLEKNIPDSIHPNLNLSNQVPYQLELHLTYLQTAINGKKNSIISIETRIYIFRTRSKLS
jgi:hypothetical protein